MTHIKKLLFVTVLALTAQFVSAQGRFGLRGGLNFANQKIQVKAFGESVSQSGDGIVSFHIGGIGEFPLAENIFVQPSILLSGKGANFDGQDDMGNPVEAKVRPFYLELPVNIIYKYPLQNFSIFGGAGIAPAFGLFGKAKSGSTSEDAFQDEGFKRFDFGVNFLAGVEVNTNMQISINITQGLANITDISDDDIDIKWKNKVIGISFAYFLQRQ